MFYNYQFDILLTTIIRNVPANATKSRSLVIKRVFDILGSNFFGEKSDAEITISRNINTLLYNKIIYEFNDSTDRTLSRSLDAQYSSMQFQRFTI